MDNLSLSDIASVTGNKDGFLEGNGIIILILFFLILDLVAAEPGETTSKAHRQRFSADLIHKLLLAS